MTRDKIVTVNNYNHSQSCFPYTGDNWPNPGAAGLILIWHFPNEELCTAKISSSKVLAMKEALSHWFTLLKNIGALISGKIWLSSNEFPLKLVRSERFRCEVINCKWRRQLTTKSYTSVGYWPPMRKKSIPERTIVSYKFWHSILWNGKSFQNSLLPIAQDILEYNNLNILMLLHGASSSFKNATNK